MADIAYMGGIGLVREAFVSAFLSGPASKPQLRVLTRNGHGTKAFECLFSALTLIRRVMTCVNLNIGCQTVHERK